ncbi:MAG: glycosyltransferase family 8 protein [Bacteroidales bacterium]|nr:glycosyltransferase family 8 protein [Bacteroidales bacterium]
MIHIAFNIDHNYVRFCAVTMVSVLENNKGHDFTFHILNEDLAADDKRVLADLAARYGAACCFYAIAPEKLKGLSISKFQNRISMATYYRCFLSDLLPSSLDRVLYLDCDLLVEQPLDALWATNLEDKAAAVVEDIGYDDLRRYETLCYPPEKSYFNAGVMLVNLDYWRKHNVPKLCMDLYREHPERIVYNDQDLLNYVMQDSKRMVDLKWNVQDGFYRTSIKKRPGWEEKYGPSLRQPGILHYTNRKPWEYENQHPLRADWFAYVDFTPFGELKHISAAMKVKRFFRLLPFTLGLRKRKYLNQNEF